ncbi:hypothetical protein WA026_001356, partial [Henosepilachna vigintioctopunctata]
SHLRKGRKSSPFILFPYQKVLGGKDRPKNKKFLDVFLTFELYSLSSFKVDPKRIKSENSNLLKQYRMQVSNVKTKERDRCDDVQKVKETPSTSELSNIENYQAADRDDSVSIANLKHEQNKHFHANVLRETNDNPASEKLNAFITVKNRRN